MFESTLNPHPKRRRRVVLALLGMPLVYLVLVNAFLNSGLLPRLISQKPELLLVRWGSAWSPWPGRVYVRDFYLRTQTRELQWELVVDRATTRVALSALLEQRFQTRWVEARGVELRLRPRVPKDEDAEIATADFPHIDGFSDDPFQEPQAQAVQTPAQREAEIWSLQLDGVTVEEIRELWVAAYRGTVHASAQGRIALHPGQFLKVEGMTLDLHSGEVFQGPLQVAHGLRGRVGCTVELDDARENGPNIWRGFDGKVQLQGELNAALFLSQYLPIGPGSDGKEGKVRFDVNVGVARGFLTRDSRLSIEGDELFAQLAGYQVRGKWSASGRVEDWQGKLRATLDVAIRPFNLEDGSGARILMSKGFRTTVSGTNLLLGETPADGLLAVELAPTAPFPLQLANRYIPTKSFRIDSGMGTLGARLSLGPGSPTKGGALEVRTEMFQVTWGDVRIRGRAVINLDLAHLRLGRKSVDLSGSSIELAQIQVINERALPRQSWNGKITLDAAKVSAQPALAASADVTGVMSDARPFLALFGEQAGLPKWATPLFEAPGLRVSGNLQLAGSTLALTNLKANGEGLQIRGQLSLAPGNIAGVFVVTVRGFTVGLKITGPKVEPQLMDVEAWYLKEQSLSASR